MWEIMLIMSSASFSSYVFLNNNHCVVLVIGLDSMEWNIMAGRKLSNHFRSVVPDFTVC